MDDNVFQLFVQELFAGFFPSGVGDFDEIRQHAGWLEAFDLAVLDVEEQTLYRLSGVGAMRKNFFERILASLLLG